MWKLSFSIIFFLIITIPILSSEIDKKSFNMLRKKENIVYEPPLEYLPLAIQNILTIRLDNPPKQVYTLPRVIDIINGRIK